MNIAVNFKIVPDDQMIKPMGDKLVVDVPLKISTYDKNAIEEAVRLKEKFGGKAVGITSGIYDLKSIKEALAMGLDEAVFIDLKSSDVYSTAMAISETLKQYNPDIVLFAEMSTDSGTSSLPGYVAELLGYPYVSYARSINIEGNKIRVERSMLTHVEVIESTLPAVISVSGEINTPRIPSIKQILEASKKPIKQVKFDNITPKVVIKDVKPFVINRKGVVIEEESVEKAVDKLLEYLKSDGVILG